MDRIKEIKDKLKKIDGGLFREDLVYLLRVVKNLQQKLEEYKYVWSERFNETLVLGERIKKLEAVREAAETFKLEYLEWREFWDSEIAYEEKEAFNKFDEALAACRDTQISNNKHIRVFNELKTNSPTEITVDESDIKICEPGSYLVCVPKNRVVYIKVINENNS